jgi:hypothetical protein
MLYRKPKSVERRGLDEKVGSFIQKDLFLGNRGKT